MGATFDARTWATTDRPGERICVGRPATGVEVLSARGSTRHWGEPLHETFTVAALLGDQRGTGGDWSTRGRKWTTTGGQLMAINAGDGHKTVRVCSPLDFDVVKLAPAWIEEAGRGLGQPPFRFRWAAGESAPVFEAVRGVTRALQQDEAPIAIESACHELAHALVTNLGEEPSSASSPVEGPRDFRLRRVREYLVEDTSTRPSLDWLEGEVDLGKSQLCALFKRAYGLSIGQYWVGRRVARAEALLLGDCTAKDVAAELGFVDEAHFSRVFKRYRGLPPFAWVSLYRQNSRGHGGGRLTARRPRGAPPQGAAPAQGR